MNDTPNAQEALSIVGFVLVVTFVIGFIAGASAHILWP